MSKDRELTAEDYRDAANRYHYATPAGEKERWESAVDEAAKDLEKFWNSDDGKAAREMLAKSGRVITFSVKKGEGATHVTFDGAGYSAYWTDGGTKTALTPKGIIIAWLSANHGEMPKGFLHWLKAKLKEIYYGAPENEAPERIGLHSGGF